MDSFFDHLLKSIQPKRFLITGGTGTFGKAMAKRLLTKPETGWVGILSRDELKQSEIQQEEWAKDDRLRFLLGDIRDRDRLMRAFSDVDVVIHAAALKQVPAGEYNPSEFIRTNTLGSMNVMEAAIDCGVGKVVALSTDKSTNPSTVYGATKLLAERLFVAASAYAGQHKTRFACVRYGNIAGSRGSVVPLFRRLIAEGKPLPITDPGMTRFWFTLERALDLVESALDAMRGGEVFVPKLPSFRITDLAEAMAPGHQTFITGIRPAEKIHESMLGPDESSSFVDAGDRYVARGNDTDWKRCLAGWDYSSGTNTQFLTVDELRKELA